jgi:two-component system phosphate regulon sensor histidine kinase PhoR
VVRNPWAAELGRFLALLLAALVLGLLVGRPLEALLVAALGYVGSLLRQLYRLERWMRLGKKSYPPPARGIWSELYQQVQRVHLRARKRKRKLANALKRLRQSVAAFPDAAVILDGDDGIGWFNAGAGRLLGLRMPEDLGQRVGNLVRHPVFLEFLEGPGDPAPVEFPSPEAEDVVLSVSLIRYGKDQRLLLARDVSHLARLEQVRRDFVANVSHELRTPLTVITGYLETLQDDADDLPPAWRRSLRAMSDQADRMAHLVRDLLLLARLESTDEPAAMDEPAPVPAIIAGLEEDLRLRSAGRHQVESAVDPALWLAGEAEQLRSVFNNLMENALQYTPDGGRIGLRWHRDEAGAHFVVGDSGIGIAPQHISRLTERFFRVDAGRSRARGGTGLGLAIVKHVLSRHGAQLRVESVPGEGSTFTCDFPPARVLDRPAREPVAANVVPLRGAG